MSAMRTVVFILARGTGADACLRARLSDPAGRQASQDGSGVFQHRRIECYAAASGRRVSDFAAAF